MYRKDALKIIVAGIVFAIISFLVNNIVAMATMNYYMMPELFQVWSKVMMPIAGPPPASFMYLSFALSAIIGMLFAAVYMTIRSVFEGEPTLKKGYTFGFLAFLIGTLPGTFSMYLMINLPVGLLAWWALSGLIVNVVAGIAVAAVAEKM
jgi:hypothetical protein